jgi:hypothetical protein
MDRVCADVLNKIHKASPEGRYVIISEDDFSDIFDGEKCGLELERVLSTLKNCGYIDVKYARGNMYCVAPKREYIEEKPIPAKHTEKPERVDKVFFCAFLGGALGSLIISLLFALL